MKVNYRVALLIPAAALLLGGIPAQAKLGSQPKAEQLIAQCNGGGYPILECEIVNGKRVCVRKCPGALLKA
jgi:hypothetical protein